jgi:TATA-box binding protein (TBP) (component of TFIID and TFIIIB)
MNFRDIEVSTKTIIGVSSAVIDIQNMFRRLPIDPHGGDDTRIVMMYYGNEKRGHYHGLKKKQHGQKSFRNAINVVALLNNHKKINFKVSKNGKFQLTGCRREEDAIRVVCHFLDLVFASCPEDIALPFGKATVYFQTVMTNIDFSVGFCIDRQRLDRVVNSDTSYHSLLETSCGYTGVNIKIPLTMPWWEMDVPCVEKTAGVWETSSRRLDEVAMFSVENKTRKRYNTFLVFHSGNVIMSGMVSSTMEADFERFNNFLRDSRKEIQERIL